KRKHSTRQAVACTFWFLVENRDCDLAPKAVCVVCGRGIATHRKAKDHFVGYLFWLPEMSRGDQREDIFLCDVDRYDWTYALSEELGVNVLYGGHYATETFGVKAMAAELSRRFRI